MTKLKTLAILTASTLALGGATVTAAQAQPWNHGYYNDHRGYSDNRLTTSYVDGLAWKIDNARAHGVIDWRMARDLHGQLASVQPLAYRVQTGQARPWEVQRLQSVVNRIDGLTSGYAYNNRRPYR
jgi:hypothetical protein